MVSLQPHLTLIDAEYHQCVLQIPKALPLSPILTFSHHPQTC